MNPLETQLRSWTPRRPSAGLERRLFGRRQTKRPLVSPAAWLAPAAACLLLVGIIFHQPGSVSFSVTTGQGTMVAMSLSNQSYAAYLPGSFQRSANRVDTFEWTNGGSSTSSIHSLSPSKTND